MVLNKHQNAIEQSLSKEIQYTLVRCFDLNGLHQLYNVLCTVTHVHLAF